MTGTKLVICPYCGEAQPIGERCRACGGLFESLSRQATHNAMGPWFVRDPERPFRPGCSYETLVQMIERGQITKYSIVRGPTTRQFWTVARHVPGVAHLLGYCHACDGRVDPHDHGCPHCGVPFGAYLDRNYLGLPDVRAGDWESADAADDRAGPGTARGLSSFAADEELLDPSKVRAAGDGQTEARRAGAARDEPATGHRASRGDTSAEDWLVSPAVRSMQRRLAAQQRAIRLLIVLLVIAVLASVVFNVVMVTSLRNGEATAGRAEPAQQLDSAPAERPGAPDRAAVAPDAAGQPAPPTTPGAWSSDGDRGESGGAG